MLSEVERLCHRAAFLRKGKLVAVEDIGGIKGRALHVIEVTFDALVDAREFALEGVRVIDAQGATLRLEVRENLDAVLKQIARHTVIDLRTDQASLEDTFRVYYEDEVAVEAEAGQHAAS